MGTDVAAFFLYHPDDFPGRPNRPVECLNLQLAWGKEIGKVIAFCTGSDGGFGFRLTSGGLTEREQRWRTCSAEFLYTVSHGEILLDNSSGGEFTFDIPNGHYRVTLHAIDWGAEPDARRMPPDQQLPNYVVCFEAVSDPAEADHIPWPPRMDEDREPIPACTLTPPEESDDFVEAELVDVVEAELVEGNVPKGSELIVLVEKDVLLLPGEHKSVRVSKATFERISDHESVRNVLLAPSDRVPTIGSASRVSGGVSGGEEPWKVSLTGDFLVTVTEIRDDGRNAIGKWRRLERPPSRPNGKLVAQVKDAVAAYARTNPRGLHIERLEATLEKWQASREFANYAEWLILTLPMPLDERRRLALVSFTEQFEATLRWLKSPDRMRDVRVIRKRTEDDRGYLNAIAEEPDHDDIRLAYADWLEKQGDPLAEFIRVGCELAKTEGFTPRWDVLSDRERELTNEHGKEWRGLFEELGIECRFRRGFVDWAKIPVALFLMHGEKLMEQGPLTRVDLIRFDRRTRSRQFENLAACPILLRLRELDLSKNQITDEEAAVLAKSPYLSNLRSLNFYRNNITAAGAKTLEMSPHLANLKVLGLAQNKF